MDRDRRPDEVAGASVPPVGGPSAGEVGDRGHVPYGPLVRAGSPSSRPAVFVGSPAPSMPTRCAVLPFKLLRIDPRGPNDRVLLDDLAPRIPRRPDAARLVLVVVSLLCAVSAAVLFESVGSAVALVPLVVLGLLLTVGAGTSAMVAASRAMRTVVDPPPEFLALCVEYQEALHRDDAPRSAALVREIWTAAGRS